MRRNWCVVFIILGVSQLVGGCVVETADSGAGTEPLAREADPTRWRSPGLECPRGGPVGPVEVDFACTEVHVRACKELSNVVIELEGGARERFEDLEGHTGTFSGTGVNAGLPVVRVWVKAGRNHSGDGPGYGERFEAEDGGCEEVCGLGVTPDTLLSVSFDGAPGTWTDPAGGHTITSTMGVTSAPLTRCDGAVAVPYTTSGLGAGFGFDHVAASGGSTSLSLTDHGVITVESWAYPTEVDPSGPTAGPKPTLVYQADGQYRLWIYNHRFVASMGGPCRAGDAGPAVTVNRWYHVLAVYGQMGGTIDLYVDGVHVDSTMGCPVVSSSAPVRVGNSLGNDVFPGYIDEVRIRAGAHPPL